LFCITNNSVYALEKEQVQAVRQPPDPESQALLTEPNNAADEKLSKALDKELHKIVEFYKPKEEELKGEYEQLVADELEFQHELEAASNVIASGSSNVIGRRISRGSLKRPMRRTSTGSLEPVDEGSSDDESPITPRPGTGLSAMEGSQDWTPSARRSMESGIYGAAGGRPHAQRSSMLFIEDDPFSDYSVSDTRITLKKRAISSYVSLCELRSFVQLNWTGFSKLLKKYDKTCNRNLRRTYLSERVEKEYPFLDETREALKEKISNVQEIYARTWTDGDIIAAQKELKLQLREHVVWERNTVWREMIGIERKAQAAALGIRSTLLGRKRPSQDASDEETKEIEFGTPLGRVKLSRWCPTWLFSANMATLLVSLAVFFALIVTTTFESIEQSNCLAMLVFVSILWATEVLTSLFPF
jgi:phosphate transporter